MNGILFMTGVLRVKYLFLLTCSFVAAVPALAQEDDSEPYLLPATPEVRITVVGTGSPVRIDQTGQAITIIGGREIASVQGPDLARVLERVPGVTITRNGGIGNFTGLRVRGADAEQLLVLVDGVRVADAAAPGGGFDLGNLLSGGVGKIELLRGSNSVVWGSQAIGGVLAVTSRETSGVEASAEYGANETASASASAGLKGEGYGLFLNAGYTRTDGVSSAAVGTEPDGFRQWRIGGRGRVDIAAGLSAVLTARHAASRLEIDGFPAPVFAFADTPEYQTTRETSGRAGLAFDGSNIDLAGGFAMSETRRVSFDPTFGPAANYSTFGRSRRADLTGKISLPSDFSLDFGADSEWTRFSTLFDAPRKARLSSGHALLGFHRDGLDLSGGVRLDDHSQFGSAWTFGANASVRIVDRVRLRASFGEGFKAPTLFQLLSDFGNAALVPETSRSFDAGVEFGGRSEALHFAATVFRRDSRNLIDFKSCFMITTGLCAGRPDGTYENIGKTQAEGFELEAGARPVEGLSLSAAYSYVKAVNRTAGSFNQGNSLARRPRHALTLAADWNLNPDAVFATTLGADVRMVSDSFDNASNTVPIDGHVLLTLRASRPLVMLDAASQSTLDLYARVENVGDVRYETTAGYGNPGRSAHVGVRARF